VPETEGPPPREPGWLRPLVALGALALVPVLPWTRVLVPIEQGTVLLVPAVAACAIIAWCGGGRAFLALIWIGLAAWVISRAYLPASSSFDRVAAGWSLLLAASFGACSLLIRGRFLVRALAAVAFAVAGGLAITAVTSNGPVALGRMVHDEVAQRNAESIALLQAQIDSSVEFRDLAARSPDLERMPETVQSQLVQLAEVVTPVYAALLACESLAVLALAWALVHRLSRSRIGQPLAPLREFRFNDQLVWGLLLGAAILTVPSLEVLHPSAWNLVVFFGALYVLRGVGVMAWYAAPAGQLTVMLVCIVFLALPRLGGALTFGLGLGDTWLDLRKRPRPSS
jgi:Predicted membrane protein (DUF2232)